MEEKILLEIMELLSQIENDYGIPRNIRLKIKSACAALETSDKCVSIRVDKSIQELDDISDDPNIPVYARTQIWNIVSKLESI